MSGQQTQRLLRLLLEAEIEHVVVGGVAAIAWGASELTRDLDIAIPYRADRIASLLAALAPYRPKHTTRPDLGVIRAVSLRAKHPASESGNKRHPSGVDMLCSPVGGLWDPGSVDGYVRRANASGEPPH